MGCAHRRDRLEFLPAEILLARSPGAPRETLVDMAGRRDMHIALAILEHQEVDGDLLHRLADAAHRSSPAGTKLAAAIAGHPSVQPRTLLKLARRTTDPDAISAILDHPETSPETVNSIARRLRLGRSGRRAYVRRVDLALQLARDPRLSPEAMERLIGLRHITVIQAVLAHPDIPRDTQAAALTRLMRVGGHRDRVRSRVARHPAAPTRFLRRLAASDDERILQAIAENPSTPPRTLHALARRFPLPDGPHGGYYGARTATERVGVRLAAHPRLRKQTVLHLLALEESAIDWAVLNRGESDDDILEGLAQTRSTDVGRALLRMQPALTDRALHALAETAARHPPNHLAETLASHPRTTPAILRRLADLYEERDETAHAARYRQRAVEMDNAHPSPPSEHLP